MSTNYYLMLVLSKVVNELTLVVGQTAEWTQWSEWSTCSVTCGYGIQKRQKIWQLPDNVKKDDVFMYEDILECITNVPCPINGSWGFWGFWSECTKMCDGGTTTRKRECNNPKPQNGGLECDGKDFATISCNNWTCPELPPNFNKTRCNETTYMCLSRLQCVPWFNRCDDTLQCHDGSDEYSCKFFYLTRGSGTMTLPAMWTIVASLLLLTYCNLCSFGNIFYKS